MSGRASIFESEDEMDVADFQPAAAPRARDPKDIAAVRETARSKGFVSREPVASAPVPADPIPQEARLRRRRTGRDKQLNLKVTDACLAHFYALADSHGWGLGETFEKALAALDDQLGKATRR